MSAMKPKRRIHDRQRGFTLIELMVALTCGALAITSIYAVGAAATRQFHQQQQIANAQTSLRMALDQVKRDIARAGYLATPNASLPGQSAECGVDAAVHNPALSGSLAAISRFVNNIPTAAGPATNVDASGQGRNRAFGFTVDELTLFGNYATAAEYNGVTLMPANDEVAISDNWHAFHVDFTNWALDPSPQVLDFDAVAFARAFTVGRLLRLRTTSGLLHFAVISGVTAPNPDLATGTDVRVRFAPAVPPACAAQVTGGQVAPVNAIRYIVRNATADSLDDDRQAGAFGPRAHLLRQEVEPGDKATLLGADPANNRVILDYVVGFNVDFTMTNARLLGETDEYLPGVTTTTTIPPDMREADQVRINNNPERIRSALIELAVRLPEHDVNFQFRRCTPTGTPPDLCSYQVFDRAGAARVRRMRAEVFLPNVAQEGY